MTDLEKELIKLKKLFEENLISKDVYEERQSKLLDSLSIESEDNEIKEAKNKFEQVVIHDNELIHHGVSTSIFFDDDLLNHNDLKRVDYYKLRLYKKFEEDPKQIRFLNMYWTASSENSIAKKIIIVPEQNQYAKNQNYKQNVFGGPFIDDLIKVCGDYDKKFKNNEYEVNNFILIINVETIYSFEIYPIDTSTISGFKNFVDNWGSNRFSKSTKEHFDGQILIKIKSKGLIKNAEDKEFNNIETSFTFLNDDIELEKIFGEIVKRKKEKISLSTIDHLHPYSINFKMSDL